VEGAFTARLPSAAHDGTIPLFDVWVKTAGINHSGSSSAKLSLGHLRSVCPHDWITLKAGVYCAKGKNGNLSWVLS
jgi:hypothetical protein